MNKQAIIMNNNISVITKNSKVILGNRNNGSFIRMSKECYNIVKELSSAQMNLSEMIECIQEFEDKIYMKELIEKLQEGEILCNQKSQVSVLKSMTFILTRQCNLRCLHCCENAENKTFRDVPLTTEDYYKIIDKISGYSIKEITLTGGEPLLRDDIKEIAVYLKKKMNVSLLLLTNGLLINKENVDWIVNTFDYISISLDGCDEELTQYIRGKNVYHNVLDKIHLLKENKFKKIGVSAILPRSLEVEDKFIALCRELEVNPEIRFLSLNGKGAKNEKLLEAKFEEYINKHGFQKYENYKIESSADINSCAACTSTLTIDHVGDIYPCNLLTKEEFVLGNIKEIDDLNEIYDKPEYKAFLSFKDYKNTVCEHCEINIFCWSCLSELNECNLGLRDFEARCLIRKPMIMKEIWGED